jgi:hypothetical protein
MGGLAWLGLFISLNQTATPQTLVKPAMAAEATAVVGVSKFTLTAIYIQPLHGASKQPLVSIGIGMRVF